MASNFVPPAISLKNFSTRFDDGTPMKQRPLQQHPSTTVNKNSIQLPQIKESGKSVQGFARKQSIIHEPDKTRYDFFKLINVDNIDYEQNDQVIKQFYNNKLQQKSKLAQQKILGRNRGNKSALAQIQVPLSLKQRNQIGRLGTDYEEYEADQRISSQTELLQRNLRIQNLKSVVGDDFDDSTIITKQKDQDQGQTLFNVVLDNLQSKVRVHKRKQVMARQGSIIKKRFSTIEKQSSGLFKDGKLQSSQQLLTIENPLKKNITDEGGISSLYIPQEKRQMQTKLKGKTVMKSNLLSQLNKRVQFDMNAEILKLQHEKRLRRKNKPKAVLKKKMKRRVSLSEGMMKYDDVRLLKNPLKDNKGPSLKEIELIKKMEMFRRYPIPEQLIHVPEDFELMLDSLMHKAYDDQEIDFWANKLPDTAVPQNSVASEEEIDFKSSSEDAADMIPMPTTRKEKKAAKQNKAKIKDRTSLELHGFNIDQFKGYPNQLEYGEFPIYLFTTKMDGKIENLNKVVVDPIRQEFKDKKYFPDLDHLQLVYEYFCQEFFTQPLSLDQYLKNGVLNVKNMEMQDQQLKAICCVIPLMSGLKEVKFEYNNIQDELASALFLACFQNPDLIKITIIGNFLKLTASTTYETLSKQFPNKIQELNMSGSIQNGENCDSFCRMNPKTSMLQSLDLSNISISLKSTQLIQYYLIHGKYLKRLNLSNCKTAMQSSRYIIEGLDRNTGLVDLNLSGNSLGSSVQEFSILIAKILTRHQSLMHLDISSTGLTKEEVIFIGIAAGTSLSCQAIHLSGNNLDYYERIFLRTLMNAKIQYYFRNPAQEKGSIRSQREKNQVMQLKNHDFDNRDLKEFVKQWNYIDEQKLGIDEEINQIIQQIDITEIFRKMKKGSKAGVEQSSILQEFIQKVQQRMEEIEQMEEVKTQQEEEEAKSEEIDLESNGTVQNFKQFLPDQNDLNPQNIPKDIAAGLDDGVNLGNQQNIFKNERLKQKKEIEERKKNRAKTAGEMALMFMGINKQAYEQLLENPMTGYMNEIILTRYIGHEDIQDNMQWKDCSQCYICEKWDKFKIEYDDKDQKSMRQNIQKLSELHQVLKEFVDVTTIKLIKKVPASKVKKMFEEDKQNEATEMQQIQAKKQEEEQKALDAEETQRLLAQIEEQKEIERKQLQKLEYVSKETPDSDKIFTESILSEFGYENYELDQEHPINSVKLSKFKLKKILPTMQYFNKRMSEKIDKSIQLSTDSGVSKYEDMKTYKSGSQSEEEKDLVRSLHYQSPTPERENSSDLSVDLDLEEEKQVQDSILALTNNDFTLEPDMNRKEVDTEATPLAKKNVNKKIPLQKKFRIVKRTIFFQGVAYLVEEEISIHSSETASVKTSEDSYKTDSDLAGKYKKRLKKRQKEQMEDEEVKEEVDQLQKALDQNRPKVAKNNFGRSNVYLVSSINNWDPIELSTLFEIKTKRKQGSGLDEFLKKKTDGQDRLVKSKKKEENTTIFSEFMPPGKHFFYFIYRQEYVFLSPRYDVVRFKGTNCFLNQIVIKQRIGDLKQVTLGRKEKQQEEQIFVKERSVWAKFQEDTPDHCKKLLEQDLAWGKTHRMSKKREDQDAVKAHLQKYYLVIKNIFLYIASGSQWPCIGLNDFTIFVHRTDLMDKHLNLATVDRTFITTNFSLNPFKNSAERELNRYEFVEIIVRLAEQKFKVPKICETLNESVLKLITEFVVPLNKEHQVQGIRFREQHMYNIPCDEIFKKNEPILKSFFELFQTPNKKYINLDECIGICKKADLGLSDNIIAHSYAEALESPIDTMTDLSILEQMKYVEFLCFISRIAYLYFEDKKGSKWELNLKIDKLLDIILATEYMFKIFSNKAEDFESAEDEASESSSSGDEDDDSEEEEEEKEEEKEPSPDVLEAEKEIEYT